MSTSTKYSSEFDFSARARGDGACEALEEHNAKRKNVTLCRSFPVLQLVRTHIPEQCKCLGLITEKTHNDKDIAEMSNVYGCSSNFIRLVPKFGPILRKKCNGSDPSVPAVLCSSSLLSPAQSLCSLAINKTVQLLAQDGYSKTSSKHVLHAKRMKKDGQPAGDQQDRNRPTCHGLDCLASSEAAKVTYASETL